MNKYLLCVIIVMTLFMIVFLYYKFKDYPDYLAIVPNEKVTTKVRKSMAFSWRNPTGLFTSTLIIPTTGFITLIDKTDSKIDSPSDTSTMFNGSITNKTDIYAITELNIYNTNATPFKLIGVSLISMQNPYITNPTNKITRTYSKDITATPTIQYDGSNLDLPTSHKITYGNINEYLLSRLIIICDNTEKKSLYIYVKNNNSYYSGILINNLLNDILIIDLYNNSS